MLNIVLFGPPGAGKGTQSALLIEKYDLIHLSTGDLLRAQIAAGTELGLRARTLMDQGVLVPDEVVIGMIESQLALYRRAKGFIFDGFPRTTAQAAALDALLVRYRTEISCMVALEVSEQELVKRLLHRGQQSGRPDDQNEALISKRVAEYTVKTLPVADYYRRQGKFYAVPGTGTVDDILAQISARIARVAAIKGE